MAYLSPNQLKQYEDEEFVSPINIFSKEKAKEIKKEFINLMKKIKFYIFGIWLPIL